MKLKRLLTGVLSAVMALSVCAMPALAAETTNKQVTFDPAKKVGSLTIHKYEQSQAENNGTTTRGEGLNDVTFEAYLVATIKQEEANGSIKLTYEIPKSLKDVGLNENAFNGTETEDATRLIKYEGVYDAVNTAFGKLSEADQEALSEGTATTKTVNNEKGIAKFDSLPLGIYMIKETKAPAQILTYTANFIVSIPMVEKGQWIYDVTAEPKNVGVYGGVNLQKVGVTAGNTSDEVGLEGVIFRLEKQEGTEWKAVDATKLTFAEGSGSASTEKSKPGADGYIVTGTNGLITITSGLTKGTYRFVEISAVNGYIANTDKNANVFEIDVENGALIVKQKGTEVKAIKVVNERPDFDKDVTKRGDTNISDNNDADYGVGDKVPYTLTIKVPQGIGSMKTFAVTDTITPTQLEYQKDVVVTGSDKNGTAIASDNYKVTYADDGSSFTVDFKPQNQTSLTEAFADQTITIKYTAKLLSGAAITSAGNVNKAELVYSNKTSVTGEETPDDKNTIHDEGVIYTFRTAIKKTDPEGKPLDGVSFVLYKKYDDITDGTIDEQTSKIQFNGEPCNVITGDAAKKYGLAAESQWIEVKSDKTANQGNITASGIPCGEYYWVETETLKGYNLLKDPVKADLTIAYKATWKTPTEYVNNVMTKHQFDKTENYDDTAMATPITVVNRKGFTLPVTGGFGTLLFSGIGVLLVLAGVCVLFSMKKKNNRA